MSTTPSQTGTGAAGGALPRKPAAYPASKPAAAATAAVPAASPSPSALPRSASAAAPANGTPAAPVSPSAKPASGSKSVSGPPAKPPKPDLFSRKNLIAGGAGAGVLVLLIALLAWHPWRANPPRLNDQPYKIAQFAATGSMDGLPWSQQREYMNLLGNKDEALRIAYKEAKLTDQEYRRALQLGWYGKHLDRMDKYFSRPPAMRTWYIDEKVLGKKYKKFMPAHPGAKKDGKPKKEKDEEKSDDASPLKPEEIDRDNSTEESDIKKWPGDVKAKWMEYRAALGQRKEFFKEQERLEKERRKAAEAKAAAKVGPDGKPAADTDGAAGASGAGGLTNAADATGATGDAGGTAAKTANPDKQKSAGPQ